MNKKTILWILGIGSLVGIGVGYYLIYASKKALPDKTGNNTTGDKGKADTGTNNNNSETGTQQADTTKQQVIYIAAWPSDKNQLEVSIPNPGWLKVGDNITLTNPSYPNQMQVQQIWVSGAPDLHGSIRLDRVFKDSTPVETIDGTRHANIKNAGILEKV